MPYNSSLAESFLKSGLKVVGKSATPELGLMFTTEPKAFGPTRNPWDLDITVGGSSGGAASAVASRIVPIAHASDGGGSIRVPAASCGLIGLKRAFALNKKQILGCYDIDKDKSKFFSKEFNCKSYKNENELIKLIIYIYLQ